MSKDLYAVLGVDKTASEKDIRSAYRKLAKELHPDLNPGDARAEERFKEVSSAFSILRDEDKRKRYDAGEIDATGAERAEQAYYRHHADSDTPHHYDSSAGFDDFVDLGDVFGEAFTRRATGQSGAQARTRTQSMQWPGADVRYHLDVDFLEAATGAKRRVTMPDGRTLDINIPAGISYGQTMRLKGQGQPGLNGGPPGDALVSIEIRPHPIFERDGNDIVVELPIGIHEAVGGGKVEVPTISGRVSMMVPTGATTGQTMRLRGKGIRVKRKSGDQLVRLKIVMPDKIDDELRDFMKSWAEKHSYNPRPKWERQA